MNKKYWSKSSWREFPRAQAPNWYDKKTLEEMIMQLSKLPALVFADETRNLRKNLKEAGEGEAFLLQCGHCSENFLDCNGPKIHNLLRVILQMSVILSYIGNKRIIKVGRIAGQYAKPRSTETENINDVVLPIYRGDMVNSFEQSLEKRNHNPKRMIDGYFRAVATLNLIRAFSKGGYASLNHISDWQKHYFKNYPIMKKYEKIVQEITNSINFIKTLGLDLNNPAFNEIDFYTSHEALLLEYEESMTRVDTTTGLYYDTSAHMLWIGERTRQPNGAYIEFIKGINNPIGLKIGPKFDIEDIISTMKIINPDNELGKLCLITRLGSSKIEKLLPILILKIKKHKLKVVWICDPMHGNTYISKTGKKVRKFENVMKELSMFWEIHNNEDTIPAGVHLEITGEDVTECVGGSRSLTESDLSKNYTSTCDPRLNAEQSVELAFFIAKLIKRYG